LVWVAVAIATWSSVLVISSCVLWQENRFFSRQSPDFYRKNPGFRLFSAGILLESNQESDLGGI
jgi:hypothetical protein